jgi:integrase
VERAFRVAEVRKPPRVGYVHVLRHSGAIYFLMATGNLKALQDKLGHSNPAMTLRYLKTLSKVDSLNIQKGVEIPW